MLNDNISFVVAAIVAFLFGYLWCYGGGGRRLPPGPHSNQSFFSVSKPIPKDPRGPWFAFDALGKQFGPIFSFFVGRTPVIVLTKAQIAWDLLEKRGEIYSSRPRQIMAHEILSNGMRGISSPYGKYWRAWRKVQNTGMSGRASLTYREHQTLESSVFLRSLLEDTSHYREHLRLFAASVVLSISYGRRATSLDSDIVQQNRNSVFAFQRASIPGQYLVESWPILLWLPRWMQWFRRDAEESQARDIKLYTSLLQEVKEKMQKGTAKECMGTRALLARDSYDVSDLELAYFVSAPFGPGIDTTTSSMEVFLLAVLRFPKVVKKVQEEIDRVVGRDRMPAFEDEDALPYVRAFIKEFERWRPIAPMGLPHSVIRDDEYDGMHIPKGATVYGNIHTMMQDPEMFPDPEAFRPERFLDTSNPRLVEFTLPFGFGRRLCPGMHVASQSLFILVTRILWAFDIVPIGEKLPDVHDFVSTGLSSYPKPFQFTVRPRSADVEKLILAEATEAEVRLKEWD
ncbi:hypothetical protein NM688_g227 [Phlebia brevispora]|uniref:Uncharacterized protein n=1 Tax=Phlebia brevispora TaxID=194682 RepID=A0ACC1TF29_9APHY|nr:hypothetical protein NM688_g227 [Phlebia brevispora]